MLTRNKVARVLAPLIVLSSIIVASPAEAKPSASCTLINKYYPQGVAVSKWSKNAGSPIKTPRVRSSVYKRYAYLDKDADGIICEVSLPNEDLYTSLDEIYELSTKATEPFDADSYFAPGVSSKLAVQYQEVIERSLAFWSQYQDLGNVFIVLWTPKDLEWAKSKYSSLTQGWGYDSNELGQDIQLIDGKQTCVRSIANTRLTKPYSTVPETNTIIRVCVHDNLTPWAWHVIAHEVTHAFQWPAANGRTPLWLIEGGATYYGLALAASVKPNSKANIDRMLYNWAHYDNYGKYAYRAMVKNPESLSRLIHKLSKEDAVWNYKLLGAAYNVGSLFVSEIVQEFGHDKFVEYTKSFRTSNDYQQNFIDVFGIDIDTFSDRIVQDIIKELS